MIQDKFNLEGRVAIVTGGAGLLGVEFSRTLAEAGRYPTTRARRRRCNRVPLSEANNAVQRYGWPALWLCDWSSSLPVLLGCFSQPRLTADVHSL